MRFKEGDKVRVKSWEEIQQCGEVYDIKDYGNAQKAVIVKNRLDFIYPGMLMDGIVTISEVYPFGYEILEFEGDAGILFDDWMIESVEE